MKRTRPASRSLCRALAVSTITLAAALAAAGTAVAATQTYDVDAVHSAVLFRAKRMGIAYVHGRFNDFAGTLEMDGEDATSGKMTFEVKTASVDTANQRRDDHLRSPDFLDTAQFPLMTFQSTGLRAVGEGAWEITGNLTLHGVTKPITAAVKKIGSGQDPRAGKSLVGFEAAFTLRRSEFGMSFMAGPVSDEIDVEIAIQAVAR